jgi:hypothetical protein
MHGTATPMLGYSVTRDATVVRRQLFRAKKATAIAGPRLRPEFIRRTRQQLGELNSAATDYVALLNSGVLDTASEEDLRELSGRLGVLLTTLRWVLDLASTLKLGGEPGYGRELAKTESLYGRFHSILEGIALSLEVEFRMSVQNAVTKLRTELVSNEPVHC